MTASSNETPCVSLFSAAAIASTFGRDECLKMADSVYFATRDSRPPCQFGGAEELALPAAETVPDAGASSFNAESATGAFITG